MFWTWKVLDEEIFELRIVWNGFNYAVPVYCHHTSAPFSDKIPDGTCILAAQTSGTYTRPHIIILDVLCFVPWFLWHNFFFFFVYVGYSFRAPFIRD
jgi:hypothetical protein